MQLLHSQQWEVLGGLYILQDGQYLDEKVKVFETSNCEEGRLTVGTNLSYGI